MLLGRACVSVMGKPLANWESIIVVHRRAPDGLDAPQMGWFCGGPVVLWRFAIRGESDAIGRSKPRDDRKRALNRGEIGSTR